MIAQRIPVLSGGFSLAAFMAQQSDGFWYDFTQTDRLFQETTGPTPANDPGEDIGLALSSRLWNGASLAAYVASQPELVTNGGFASGLDNWADAGGNGSAVVVGGVLQITEGTSREERRQVLTVVAGRTYRVSATLGGSLPVIFLGSAAGNADLGNIQATGERFITATTTTLSIRLQTLNTLGSGLTATFDNISVREVSRYAATQATASFKPKYQTTGAAFDGADDNLLTNYTAGSGANTIIAKVVVPAMLAGTQVIAGARNSVDTRSLIAFDASGRFGAGVGAVGNGIIRGDTDFRSQTVVVGVTYDGSTVRLFEPSGVAYEAAQSGAATTTMPYRIGAFNDNGTAGIFFGGSVQQILGWQGGGLTDLARFNQIANALGA